ncbi:hypothetical protein DXG01_010905 [Tephrocybe rancida]|nr:hypothetical protein DXG01_010905 [Tephrocybe rancida]
MTPPATVPTSTLALPPADAELSPIPTEHNNWDDSFCAFPSASTTPDHDNGVDPLLSPISPEWTTNNISYEAPLSLPSGGDSASVLLGSNYSHLFPAPGTLPYLHQSDDTNTSPHCRPILPHLDIPFHYMPPKGAWSDSPTSSMDYDDELDMLATPSTMDMDMPSTPKSFPTTPFSHELSLTSDDKLFENGFRNEKYGFYDPPLHEFEFLPELDDIPNSPSSPSLRGFSRLPGLELDDDNADDLMFTSPPSPGATLISLPGTDPDDFSDLGPQREQADFSLPPSPFSPSSSSLLLLDEEGLPRSPSPENYDVDPASTEDSSNPDIRRLGELRKRSSNAERAARQLEQALMEQGAVHQRWEARRARKKEKERGREIGAMLRLKMAEEMEKQKIEVEGIEAEVERERENGTPIRMRKGMISSMEQLVAKMMLRRNDSYRSLANRKTPLTSKFHMSSPLVRYGDLASDSDLDLDDELEGLTSFGTGDFDSEPWIPPAWTT